MKVVLAGLALLVFITLGYLLMPRDEPATPTRASAASTSSPDDKTAQPVPTQAANTPSGVLAGTGARSRADEILAIHQNRSIADVEWAKKNQQKLEAYFKQLNQASERDSAMSALRFEVTRTDCREKSCIAEMRFPNGYQAAISLNGMIDELVIENRLGAVLKLDCPKKRFVPIAATVVGPVVMLMHFDCE